MMIHCLHREKKKRGVRIPSFDELLTRRDYQGALVLLEYNTEMSYIMELGDCEKSQKAYLELLSGGAGKIFAGSLVILDLSCIYQCYNCCSQ